MRGTITNHWKNPHTKHPTDRKSHQNGDVVTILCRDVPRAASEMSERPTVGTRPEGNETKLARTTNEMPVSPPRQGEVTTTTSTHAAKKANCSTIVSFLFIAF